MFLERKKHDKEGELQIDTDYFIPLFGLTPKLGPIADWGLNIENQAIGRADRIGQKRPIEIIRFIIKNTIEEDILNDNNQLDNENNENNENTEVLVV